MQKASDKESANNIGHGGGPEQKDDLGNKGVSEHRAEWERKKKRGKENVPSYSSKGKRTAGSENHGRWGRIWCSTRKRGDHGNTEIQTLQEKCKCS